MTLIKKIQLLLSASLLCLPFVSCKKEDASPKPVEIIVDTVYKEDTDTLIVNAGGESGNTQGTSYIRTQDLSVNVAENPQKGQELGQLIASSSDDAELNYQWVDAATEDVIHLDPKTGVLTVKDPETFDHEKNDQLRYYCLVKSPTKERKVKVSIEVEDVFEPFIMTIYVKNGGDSFYLYTLSSSNFNINWGDGTIQKNQSSTARHKFKYAGSYQLRIWGDIQSFQYTELYQQKSAIMIRDVQQWGDTEWYSFNHMFSWCKYLKITAKDSPNITDDDRISAFAMFAYATYFNSDISHWDVSNIETAFGFKAMFNQAISFDQDLSSWEICLDSDAELTDLLSKMGADAWKPAYKPKRKICY